MRTERGQSKGHPGSHHDRNLGDGGRRRPPADTRQISEGEVHTNTKHEQDDADLSDQP
jgi:hypothetical protein